MPCKCDHRVCFSREGDDVTARHWPSAFQVSTSADSFYLTIGTSGNQFKNAPVVGS